MFHQRDRVDRWPCARRADDHSARNTKSGSLATNLYSRSRFCCRQRKAISSLPRSRSSASAVEWLLETLISILGHSSRRTLVAGGSQTLSSPTAKAAVSGLGRSEPRPHGPVPQTVRQARLRGCRALLAGELGERNAGAS